MGKQVRSDKPTNIEKLIKQNHSRKCLSPKYQRVHFFLCMLAYIPFWKFALAPGR